MREFLKQVADQFDISPSGTHVAAVAYSTKPAVVFKFNTLQGAQLNVDEVNKRLDKMPHQRGLTFIDRALVLANNEVFTKAGGMRDDIPKVRTDYWLPFLATTTSKMLCLPLKPRRSASLLSQSRTDTTDRVWLSSVSLVEFHNLLSNPKYI